MRKIFFSIALLGMLGPATAQELYMPRNIKKAYANGTRDLSGAPGKKITGRIKEFMIFR